MLRRDQKLAIYMEGAVHGYGGKMGFGVLRYSPNPICCVIDTETAGLDMMTEGPFPKPCPIVASIEKAHEMGAEVFVLGIAPPGGLIPQPWYAVIDRAVELGMSVINGLHDLLGPRYPQLPDGQWVWDIRIEPPGIKPGTGAAAGVANRRLLLVGTDMAIGKMTAGLEIYRTALERGKNAEFVATGQIGITITGSGVPLDAVRVDFSAGAIEREVMNRQDAELVIVEGQGSLNHPGSTATLALMRGSMPTHLVLCHRAGQTHLTTHPEVPIAPLGDLIRLYENLASACGLFPSPTTIGVALNTSHVKSDDVALDECAALESELGLPCVDPVRHGPDRLLDRLFL
ncbi:MAG: DUF1611 domain-containing protein [Fimbriimonas sp.]|nr:DUF1611 domain-containing protein [Fimbriimonas sp.]